MLQLFIRLLLSFLLLPIAIAENNTMNIYSDVENSVYQIQVLHKQTGKKSVIGSGFVVGQSNILATNYHVVSSYVTEPETYKLEYFSTSGETGDLELLDLDIVHDLAVVRAKKYLGEPLKLTTIPDKGASLYSLGNPMDLGFSIVEGTNNGLMKYSEDKNILFSGSLNPGMSGGPTLDADGNIIGINVATSGNEISFLVPAKHLAAILERLKARNYVAEKSFLKLTSSQLLNANSTFLKRILNTDKWVYESIGGFSVPSELSRSVRCWDTSREPEKDDLFRSFFIRCSNERSIYLDTGLEVGVVEYEYQWVECDALNPARFYDYYE
jgi:S1-C subfamily serine protease